MKRCFQKLKRGEKMIGGSYRQAVFTGLKKVSDRCPEPCGKAFWHFYSGVNFEVINNFYGPVGPRGWWGFARKE